MSEQLQKVLPHESILSLVSGFWVSQLVRALVKNNVFDEISQTPKTPQEIAQACEINEDICSRCLATAEGFGLVKRVNVNQYEATETGKCLSKSHPSGLRNIVLLETSLVHTRLWENFDHTLKTGLPACKVAYPGFPSNNYYHVFSSVPGHLRVFEDAMKGYALNEWALFDNSSVDFSKHKVLVDVGAGDGYLLEKLLNKYQQLKGVFFDQPPVCEAHKQCHTVSDRYSLVGGDFFRSVPTGDAYILKHILHDWSDEFCLKILYSVNAAARLSLSSSSTPKIYIAELVLKKSPETQFAKLYDLHIAVASGGKERTLEELTELLTKAGFKVFKIHYTQSDMAIIEAELV
eukprot:TRINITY_DN8416_c0_g1_i1.p1 TRINITY_DN8416_c0_g1~~TRINITY_DN8416_c0_g1_i1.p1  ORF type:complete len:378 (-),score=83.10 TRINITY_DN8416_c0_g1_i1:94-1137(-)